MTFKLYTNANEIDQWRWSPEFEPHELACPSTGSLLLVPEFMDKLHALRMAYSRPMVITSGYRCPAYNDSLSTTGRDGPHTTGRAVDVLVSGSDAHRLVGIAIHLGFKGIGLKQKGPHNKRFIHLDDLTEGPRPWVWTY